MFCPKCGLTQPSEDLRFCPRCGMRLAPVRELVGAVEPGEEARPGEDVLPRQKDLITGALLMFLGGVAGVLWGLTGPSGSPEVVLPQAYAVMGFTLAFILVLFHPLLGALQNLFSGGEGARANSRKQRDGINLGAILMFVGTLKAILLTYALPRGPEKAVTIIFIMALVFALLLFLRPILKAVHRLFFKEAEPARPSDEAGTARLDSPRPEAALPPARAIPVNQYAAPRTDTAELAEPPSVTEDATRRFDG